MTFALARLRTRLLVALVLVLSAAPAMAEIPWNEPWDLHPRLSRRGGYDRNMLQPLPYYWGGRGPLVTTPGASGWPGFGARWPAYRERLPPVAPMDVPVYPGRRTPATPAEPHAMLPPSLVPPAIKAPKQGE